MFGNVRDYEGIIATLDFHHVGLLARVKPRDIRYKHKHVEQWECHCYLFNQTEFVVPYDGLLLQRLDRDGERLHHICYQCTELEATCNSLRNKGFYLLMKKPIRGVCGWLNFIIPEDRGVMIELCQLDS